tara:strand:+ start:355 stop:2115 length:1761 start_codon:yes stop_codon:yes gene_type:complete
MANIFESIFGNKAEQEPDYSGIAGFFRGQDTPAKYSVFDEEGAGIAGPAKAQEEQLIKRGFLSSGNNPMPAIYNQEYQNLMDAIEGNQYTNVAVPGLEGLSGLAREKAKQKIIAETQAKVDANEGYSGGDGPDLAGEQTLASFMPGSDPISEEIKKLYGRGFKPKDIGEAPVQEKFGQITVPEDERFKKDTKNEQKVIEDTYSQVMQSLSSTPAEGKTLADYKKEFFEATGIDSSGKVDKSDALMAFGLALMQNRAGKGFNIGRMLRSVGEAGEKAQPLLRDAKKQAKSEQIAAGKYALDRQAEFRKYVMDLQAEEINRKQDFLYDLEKAKFAGDGEGYRKALEKIRENVLKVGGVEFKVARGTDGTSGQVVFADPTFDSNKVLDAYVKTEAGLESIEQIDDILTDIQNLSSDTPGGMIGYLATSKVKKFARLIGFNINDTKYIDEETGAFKEDQLKALQKGLVSRFKRFMTQETGNGISNVDVSMIGEQTGEIDFFTDPAGAKARVAQLRNLFTLSKTTLDPIISEYTDRTQYRAGSVGDEQFLKVQEKIEKTVFGGKYKDLFERSLAGEDDQGNKIYNINLADI